MRRTAAILPLVLVVSLLVTSDVRGGGGALLSAGKTIGPRLIATIVTDVTCSLPPVGCQPDIDNPDRGLTSIRVQKLSQNVAAIFNSSYVKGFFKECINEDDYPNDLEGTTASRFTGLIDLFVDDSAVRTALFGPFGDADKAAITDQDDVACTEVNGRKILSFTAVIKFQKPPK